MKISKIETFILHVPVTGNHIADAMHSITHWGVPGCVIHTDEGLAGYGFAGTHGHLPTDKLITDCIAGTYAPLLVGEVLETREDIARLWKRLYHFPPAQWVGRSGITHLGLAAVDVALWDLLAKAAGQPLWALLGEPDPAPLVAYNTDGGWLNLSLDQVVDNCRRFVEQDGFGGVKIKVGKPDLSEDLDRVAAVRAAIGAEVMLMVDANGKWDLDRALRADPVLHELGVFFVEEPLWYDDIAAHRTLASDGNTKVALGEQLYSYYDFKNFIDARALHMAQPDVTRLAGISEWLRVADLAATSGLPVIAHAGDMGQVHVHTSLAHHGCSMLEYIPWIRDCYVEPMTVRDGTFVRPNRPGAGTQFRDDASRFLVHGALDI